MLRRCPWCCEIQVMASWGGVLKIAKSCGGKCGVGVPGSGSGFGSSIAQLLWPPIDDAIVVAFDGLAGTAPLPKCTHIAGIITSSSEASMLECLRTTNFSPSGHRAIAIVANRVAACIQPTRRLAPTLLPEGLGPGSMSPWAKKNP